MSRAEESDAEGRYADDWREASDKQPDGLRAADTWPACSSLLRPEGRASASVEPQTSGPSAGRRKGRVESVPEPGEAPEVSRHGSCVS